MSQTPKALYAKSLQKVKALYKMTQGRLIGLNEKGVLSLVRISQISYPAKHKRPIESEWGLEFFYEELYEITENQYVYGQPIMPTQQLNIALCSDTFPVMYTQNKDGFVKGSVKG